MPRRTRAALPPGPFRVTADGTDSLSRAETRTTAVVAPSRAVRIPVALADDLLSQCRGIDLVDREDAAFWGPTASELLALPIPYRLEQGPIHVLVPEGMPRPRRRGVRTRQADITADEVVAVAGLRVTSAARTYCDLAAFLGPVDLIAVGDAVLRDHAVSADTLLATVQRRLRYPGKVLAREMVPFLDPRSASPQESRLRGHVVLTGFPVPEVNAVITDEHGGFLAVGDLVYRDRRIVIEYDGAVHDEEDRRRRDATRRTLLRQHGWHVVEIVDVDLRFPERALAKIRHALYAQYR